jgi:hypothetical protein
MDQALADVRQQRVDAQRDKDHPFHSAPESYWQKQEATVMAFRVRAGLAPKLPVKAPQQLAAEQHAASFFLPDELHPNMVEALNARLEPLAGDRVAREEATKQLKTELGAVAYNALVQDAQLYKQTLTDAEKADRVVLQTYASQAGAISTTAPGRPGNGQCRLP